MNNTIAVVEDMYLVCAVYTPGVCFVWHAGYTALRRDGHYTDDAAKESLLEKWDVPHSPFT